MNQIKPFPSSFAVNVIFLKKKNLEAVYSYAVILQIYYASK